MKMTEPRSMSSDLSWVPHGACVQQHHLSQPLDVSRKDRHQSVKIKGEGWLGRQLSGSPAAKPHPAELHPWIYVVGGETTLCCPLCPTGKLCEVCPPNPTE